VSCEVWLLSRERHTAAHQRACATTMACLHEVKRAADDRHSWAHSLYRRCSAVSKSTCRPKLEVVGSAQLCESAVLFETGEEAGKLADLIFFRNHVHQHAVPRFRFFQFYAIFQTLHVSGRRKRISLTTSLTFCILQSHRDVAAAGPPTVS
jgi:hypothetical protein